MSRVTQGVLAAAALALLSGGAVAAYAQSADVDRTVAEAREDARDAQMSARDAQDRAREAGQRGREAAEHGRMMAEHGRRMAIESRDIVMREFDPKAHADHLRNILQLRPNQEAALSAYLEATGPKHGRMVEVDNTPAPKTTPERLARMEKRLAEREAAGRARIEATRRFYGQLDERQKKAFDELPMVMGPMMMDGGPGRMVQIMHRGPGFERFEHPPLPPLPPGPPPMPPMPPVPPRS